MILTDAGLKGSQRARSARRRPKATRASVARQLYLKLLTRQTMKPGTRQTKIVHIRQIKSHTYHSIICTEKALVQGVPPLVQIYGGGDVFTLLFRTVS